MTPRSETVVLIGPMGAGKTSIGRKAARALQVPFFDTDSAVVRAHGPIEKLFTDFGEAHFRRLERDAVVEGLERGGVISLGGGAVLDPETRSDLAARRVILLTVSPNVVAGRVRASNRPLLQGDDAMTRWTTILAERMPIYRSLADVTFDTSSGPVQHIVDAVVDWIRDDPSRPMDTEETR